MTEYSGIRGTRVKYLSSDPTLNTSTEGQVWYNSTSGTLKSLVQIKAWSSSGSLGTARRLLAGTGTQTAGLAFGGLTATANTASTEEYSGFSWSAGGNMGTTRRSLGAAGTQTAALGFGGYITAKTNATEEYDGSSWTAGGNLNTERRYLAGCGIQNAGLAFGGLGDSSPASVYLASTEEYDGSSWTAVTSMNTARNGLGSAGTQTAALGFGGNTGTTSAATEEYDGSSWTISGNLNTGRESVGGAGIQTDALAFGGYIGSNTGATEEYDGTNWTTSSASLATARNSLASAGTRSAGLAAGGTTGSVTAATEEYNSNINVTPAAVWSSGGNMNTTRRSMAAAGITSSGLAIGGFGPPYIAAVEEYNGTSWSSANNTPVAKENSRAGAGIQTAAFNAGGSGTDNGPAYSDSTQEYDGTNWTAGGNMNQQGLSRTSCGTLTAGLGFGGYIGGGFTTATEEYDGTSWTTSGTVPTASYYACAGTQTAALGVRSSSSPLTINYNGSTWTAGTGNLNVLTDIGSAAKNGTEIKTVFFGGNAGPANTGATEEYDGTAFTNTASLTTARGGMAGSGDTDEAFAGGGFTGTNTNVTEEYTYQGASAATASTLTTS
jgi:hypothetical protein